MARVVGNIAPPLQNYCRIYAVLTPADDDVLNLTALDTQEIHGNTLLIRGRFLKSSQDVWQDFALRSPQRIAVEMELISPQTGRSPLAFKDPVGHALVLIDKHISADLFDGLSADSLLDGSAVDTVLARLTSTFRVHEFARPQH
ncbi:MAG: hypothetical protein H0U74_09475 [Bradymonadaceae bacterium]|nr:hypothetical protein [Lujinxingiaceae bacterium]